MGSSTVRAPRAVVWVLAAGGLAGLFFALPTAQSDQTAPALSAPSLQVAALLQGNIPVVAEHRYRIAGKIRPLLFWFGRDNVGGARVRWRRGTGDERGYDLLIGSDPARAPRQANRWGFIMEEATGAGATVLGVMKKGTEDSLEEAKSNVAAESAAGAAFHMMRATLDSSESVSRVTSVVVERDYSYHELGGLMERLLQEPPQPEPRRVRVPPNGRFGLLLAIADLLHDGVETARSTSKAPARKSLPYAYYKNQYDLTRVSSEIEKQPEYGGAKYPRLLRSSFEIKARGETWTEHFTIACGIDGPLAEVPVFMTYQPRWWMKLEMVLDERQQF